VLQEHRPDLSPTDRAQYVALLCAALKDGALFGARIMAERVAATQEDDREWDSFDAPWAQESASAYNKGRESVRREVLTPREST
jgi:hypothetical protein